MKRLFVSTAAVAVGLIVVLGVLRSTNHAPATDAAPPVVADGISGVVTGPKGAEAGIWVIAATKDLKTPFTKIVVTDDQGRFVVPELPQASYKVWVRGYGLVDSDSVQAQPGAQLKLTAKPAPDAKAAAQYYPANYWWALVHPPVASEFPGTGAQGNGIDPAMKTQQQWMANLKVCASCHQLGDQWTRAFGATTSEQWDHRIQFAKDPGDPVIGNKGAGYAFIMKIVADRFGRDSMLRTLVDWGDRVAKGALPAETPPRPSGIERNVVITEWDTTGTFIHDQVASDRRNPSVNAHGLSYGLGSHVGKIVAFSPATLTAEDIPIPDGENSFPHSITMDSMGRAWVVDFGHLFQLGFKPRPLPEYCADGSANKYASYFPQPGAENRVFVYDPATRKVTTIPTCFRSQHQWFDNDANNTLYFAGDQVVGWIDTKVWDDTHDAQKATGWCPMVIDTKTADGGKPRGDVDVAILPERDQWNTLGKSADPTKDTRIPFETYGLSVNPVDHSVWFGITDYPGGIVRFERGTNAPDTCKSEYYVPPKLPDGSYASFAPHDVGIDSKGIAWVTFTSGQVGRFDRSQCKVRSGPTATGEHCPEGWTIYDDPNSPKIAGTALSADFYYQMYVDQHNVFGLGNDVPLVPASNSDAMVALLPATGKYVTFRVPYPMGYFGRWTDARIDDATTGWKGRGIWSQFSTVPVWHQEMGLNGINSMLTKFQLRPDPLAH